MKKYLRDMISALLVLLFVYAAVSKLLDFEKFEIQLGQSVMLAPFVKWVVWSVPGFELLISFLLISRKLQLYGLYGAFSLMVMFSTYIVFILNFATHIPCSCGGILENMSWQQHLIFNLGFVCLAATGVLIVPKSKGINF